MTCEKPDMNVQYPGLRKYKKGISPRIFLRQFPQMIKKDILYLGVIYVERTIISCF